MEIEDIRLYCPGGYHPVRLGDKFNDRYIIEHKLGHGGFSTVWLAQDAQMQRLVALKINVAADDDSLNHEASFLRILNPRPQTPGRLRLWDAPMRPFGSKSSSRISPSFFPQLLDEFTINGPNSEHHCLVTDVLGPSLCGISKTELPVLTLEVARRVVIQLVQAVAKLSECGIVHADLHPSNILFRIPGIESWTVANAHNHFGKPQLIELADIQIPFQLNPLPMSPHLPEYLVYPPSFSSLETLCLESPAIAIADFGLSFHWTGPEDDVRKTIGSPPSFAAPEVQLLDTITPACNVWSLGCLLYTLFGGNYMWFPMFGDRDCLFDLTLCFGKLPDPLWKLWKDRGTYYDEDGVLKPEEAVVLAAPRDMETKILNACRGMEQEEYAWFRRVMLEIFKLDPRERMPAVEVVRYVPPQWWEDMRGSA